MSDYQIEMLWRCSSCGGRNRGRDVVCSGCGNPKDGSEQYEMPDDTSRAAEVRDPELLRMAKAGANWRCAYCGSDQRRYDGACATCGGGREQGRVAEDGPRARSIADRPPSGRVARTVRRKQAIVLYASLGSAFLFLLLVVFVSSRRRPPPMPSGPAVEQTAVAAEPEFVDREGVVTARAWRRVVTVERWQLWPFEGFLEQKPETAIEVKDLGQRVHHYDSVLDGYDTKTWTEQVPDGYDTQSYTATEACGQSCVPRSPICTNVCTSGKNGFATCRNVCSGGGQTCTPRFCTVTKTKQVPRTKTVTKSKQEPRYRKEARYATWYGWRALAWKPVRTVVAEGHDEAPHLPSDAEIALGKDERTAVAKLHDVTLAWDDKTTVYRPVDEATFLAMPSGSKHVVRVHRFGSVEVLPHPVAPASSSSPSSSSSTTTVDAGDAPG